MDTRNKTLDYICKKLDYADMEYIRNLTFKLNGNNIDDILHYTAILFVVIGLVVSDLSAIIIGITLLSLCVHISYGCKNVLSAVGCCIAILVMSAVLFVVSDASILLTFDHSKDIIFEILAGTLVGCAITAFTLPLAFITKPFDY